ncbi:hypothetical protein [Rhodospirillum centenum]|uniref:Uncharacterized protein n=1 Tax=Rhodospirillum centenum (strain ATCC 51521 / SW) TaxID=414684 RepID=B6IPI2_RHOCS|nr:hypothetical protein [Rhodospirillum centenum]ACI99684.1 hypothetical protein RC1_2297 [Rhodospirillum centenum SW]
MPYLIRDARDETHPEFEGWLASPIWVGYTWSRKAGLAKRFDTLAEATRIARTLNAGRRSVVVVEVQG